MPPRKYQTSAELVTGDIEIGAVEMKDGTTDTRAKVAATSSVAEGDSALAVQAPVLGATTGAALSADGNGTLQQYARSLFKEFLARIGAVDGAALTVDGNGTLQQYLRSLLKAVGWYDDAAATTTGTLSAKLRGLLIVTGVTTDAAVITDANGTLQGYLRGLVKIIAPQVVTTIANALATSADATSDVLTLDGTPRHVHLSIVCPETGTRAGPIYIQESDDGTTWYNLAIDNRLTGAVADNIPLVASVALSVGVDVETSAQRLRCFFDYTSGTTAALTIKAKVK